jgi:hypothetical protein
MCTAIQILFAISSQCGGLPLLELVSVYVRWRENGENCITRSIFSSPSIIGIIKSRRMRCAGHVARMGEKGKANRLLAGRNETTTNTKVGG